jgi:hypothetical protein
LDCGRVNDPVGSYGTRVLVTDSHTCLNPCIHDERILVYIVAAGLDDPTG